MYLTHKIEIKPNKTIKSLLNMYFGYSRHIYNRGLSLWNDEYQKGNKPNFRKVRDIIKANKYDWYDNYAMQVIETSLEDLDKGFSMFYKGLCKHPKFKSKKQESRSIRFYRKNDSSIRVLGNKLYLPKFPYGIKLTEELRFEGVIKTCTISQKADRYFASFTIDCTKPIPQINSDAKVGIDLGVKTFAVYADDEFIYEERYPSKIKAYYAKRDYLNKVLARKEKGSKRYFVAKTKLQKVYLRIINMQKDYLHKLTSYFTRVYGTITIETLNVKGMLKLRNLAKSVYQSLFYNFKELLSYKARLYGNNLVLADRWYASTQTCWSCGKVKRGKDKLTLNDRTYTCECGYENDRDHNAALNLRDYSLNELLG